ncbi:hypothetical protein CONLIGDRAFT_670539 [Coniochaeta ligniaria NRRL 30616]|uniref:Uncharacterized protein n=1 Tax=Coniochaeta ligniaria NRRL 30616 TaxID=1408157 RepID=A0A1J7J668_9PEZI|nr:hypothetical protein CONLIGDRAFT_670539 [Coniochaeta ligniaria NRRL 30616]
MKSTAVIASILALALSASATPVPALNKRVSWPCGGTGPCPVAISEFTLFSTPNNCAAADAIASHTSYKGYDSDTCHPVGEVTGGAAVFGVSETDGDRKCQLTVFKNGDCSDGGIPIGITPSPNAGCFSDAAGIQAFKVQCPWWN